MRCFKSGDEAREFMRQSAAAPTINELDVAEYVVLYAIAFELYLGNIKLALEQAEAFFACREEQGERPKDD
jgi:hypothetical protein